MTTASLDLPPPSPGTEGNVSPLNNRIFFILVTQREQIDIKSNEYFSSTAKELRTETGRPGVISHVKSPELL